MAVYKKVNENIRSIIDFISKNSDLKKLIAYDNGNPLAESEPFIHNLINDRVYLSMKIVTPDTNAKSYISIYKNYSNMGRKNDIYNRNVFINIDVVCHETLWLLDSGDIRPLLILDAIDSKLTDISIDSIRGNLIFKDCKHLIINDKFSGYRFIYELTNFSKDCDK